MKVSHPRLGGGESRHARVRATRAAEAPSTELSPPSPAQALRRSTEARRGGRRLPAAVVRPLAVALVALFAMTSMFVEAFHAPRPNGVPIGVVAAPASAAGAQHALNHTAPGAFQVRDYPTEAHARHALTHADIRGVLAPGRRGDQALVAQAYGLSETQAVTTAFESIAAHSRASLRVTDAMPLPTHDRNGLSSMFTIIATLLPSLAFGAALAFFAARLSWWRRWGAILAYAILAAVVITVNVDLIIAALTATFIGIAVVGGLFALAVASCAHGFTRLAGAPGLAATLTLLVIVGFPAPVVRSRTSSSPGSTALSRRGCPPARRSPHCGASCTSTGRAASSHCLRSERGRSPD